MQAETEQYYKEHGRNVYLYLMTLCNEPETAEELMQETFLQAMKHLDSFRGDSSAVLPAARDGCLNVRGHAAAGRRHCTSDGRRYAESAVRTK